MVTYEQTKSTILLRMREIAFENIGNGVISNDNFSITAPNDLSFELFKTFANDLVNEKLVTQEITNLQSAWKISGKGIRLIEENETKAISQARPNFTNFKISLLIELAKQEKTNGSGFYYLQEIADEVKLSYEDGWLSKAAESLRDLGLIKDSFTSSGYGAELTAEGLEEVERLTDNEAAKEIPASDRIVKRSDNSDKYSAACDGAVALREAMEEANNHGDLDDDEFEQKLSEVRALQIMLDAPQVQWDVLDQFTINTVKYLAKEFVDKAIGKAAAGLLVLLSTLLRGTF